MPGMNFTDASVILNELHKQVTGREAITPANTADFVSVANATIANGFDPVMKAISEMVGRTVFSSRVYSAKLGALQVDGMTYGNHVRKITMTHQPSEPDQRYSAAAITDGQSVDMYTVRKPSVVQTNFYGGTTRQRHYTVYREQLNTAFTSPEEFGHFMSLLTTENSNMIEQELETLRRGTILNYIGGKQKADSSNVFHLLTEYNAATGKELTVQTVKLPENYPAFVAWAMSRIKTISDMMTERTTMFHQTIGGEIILRHSPIDCQRLYVHAPQINEMETRVFANTFHTEYLNKLGAFERVNFWQSIETPDSVKVCPSYMNENGEEKTETQPIEIDNVFAVLADSEAMGCTVFDQWSSSTPINSAGGYWNIYHHWKERYWNDHTENGCIFLLN